MRINDQTYLRWGDVDRFTLTGLAAANARAGRNVRVELDRPLVWRVHLQATTQAVVQAGETITVAWELKLGVGSSFVTAIRIVTFTPGGQLALDVGLDVPAQTIDIAWGVITTALAGGGGPLEVGTLVTPYNLSELFR